MLGDLSGVSKIFVITGRTDMRKSFDGLMAIIRDTYELDPYANAVYLFCGRDSRKLKALHFDKDGFVLLQKNPRKGLTETAGSSGRGMLRKPVF